MERIRARAALVLAVTLVAAGCGWTQFRGGPEGTGFNPAETTITRSNVAGLRQAWTRPVGWTLPYVEHYSPIARSGDTLVVAALRSSVVLDAVTGALRRSVAGADDVHVAIDEGRAIISGFIHGDSDGHIRSVDLASGSVAWSSTTNWGLMAPVVADGVVAFTNKAKVGIHDYGLEVWRASDGQYDARSRPRNCCSGGTPSLSNGTLFFTDEGFGEPRTLVALDLASHTVKFSPEVPQTCRPTQPVVTSGRIYVSGRTFDASNGAKLWDWPVCSDARLVTVSPSTVFVPHNPTSGTSALQALNAATGAVRWTVPWGRNATGLPSAPAAANDLLFAADGNSIVAYDATTGVRVWRSPRVTGFLFSDPIVSDGMVYAMNTNGSVYAYAL